LAVIVAAALPSIAGAQSPQTRNRVLVTGQYSHVTLFGHEVANALRDIMASDGRRFRVDVVSRRQMLTTLEGGDDIEAHAFSVDDLKEFAKQLRADWIVDVGAQDAAAAGAEVDPVIVSRTAGIVRQLPPIRTTNARGAARQIASELAADRILEPRYSVQNPDWIAERKPFRLYGNTYYVGTQGLSSILITSASGHVLIDATLAENAPLIEEHIRQLGFRVEDVKLILNSHAHYDHAAGTAALQRASAATVAASPWTARVMEHGKPARDDPQFGLALDYSPVKRVQVIRDGETLKAGAVSVTAHFTPGHTPGGTSWSWQSCENDKCLDMVYADSQSPVSADGYLFTKTG
jgi:hypothetical protein